jgi:thiol-disulfide isomerase/thioredoxin
MRRVSLILCAVILAGFSTARAGDPVTYKEIAMLLRNGEKQQFIIEEIGRRKLIHALSPQEEQSLLSLRAAPALMATLHDPAQVASAQQVNTYLARLQKQNQLAYQEEQASQRAAQLQAQAPRAPLPGVTPPAPASATEGNGKPISLKFTAADGTPFDLAQWRGKVVLLDFWATWCGPCMHEVPHVVDAYSKFHGKGFEIVGISLDNDKNAMLRTTAQKRMTWPQYFDGKGWNNAISSAFHIRAIPAMWLIDKNGNVVTTDARNNLEGNIASLLAR